MRIELLGSNTLTGLLVNHLSNQKNSEEAMNSTEGAVIQKVEGGKNLNIWSDMAQQIDIRNASFEELCDVSLALYQTGQITLLDHASLTFNPNQSPQELIGNYFMTKVNADGKRDWIAEYEARAARDLKMNNLSGYEYNKDILEILARLTNGGFSINC